MSSIKLTKGALEAMTNEQKEAMLRLLNNSVAGIGVQTGGFDLPDGYLAFRQDYPDGSSIYGGIAPNGDVST